MVFMKKFFVLGLVFCVSLFLLCACGNGSGASSSDVSKKTYDEVDAALQDGNWVTMSPSYTISNTFNDGKYTTTFYVNGKLTDITTGTYTITDDTIILSESADENILKYTYQDGVLKLTLDGKELIRLDK